MKLRMVVLSVVAAAAVGLMVHGATAKEVSETDVIASGVSSTGAGIGPDGALYAGVGGTAEGADQALALPAEVAEENGFESVLFGLHSSVMRVDPETGEVTTYAGGLPSASDVVGGEPFVTPADVIWVGDTMYVLLTGGAPQLGGAAADWPNGIYRHEDEGSWSLVADINEFNLENPVDFPDAGPEGNPFAIDVRNGEFIVSDGNHNRLLRATMDGEISEFAAFDNVVPTGLATTDSGQVLNTWFGPGPHAPGSSFLVSLAFPTGAVTEVADTFEQLIDVEIAGGHTYVLQFGDQQLDENAPPPPGRLLVLDGDVLKTLVTGLMLPTSVNFVGDTAFITSLTGDVTKVEGVSAIAPIDENPAPPPAPTASAPVPTPTVPAGTITAPDTGSGPAAEGANFGLYGLIALALAGSMVAGYGILTKRS